jgi:adenylate kinase
MKVFVNDVTGHVGAALVELLTLEENGHEVVGCCKPGATVKKAEGVGTVLEETEANAEAIRAMILGAEAVVFSAQGNVQATVAAMKTLREHKPEADEKTFVLISSAMSWSKTPQPKQGGEEEEFGGFREENYTSRRPNIKFQDFKTLETKAMSIARENLKAFVVAPGLLYGRGEDQLHSFFKQSWLCDKGGLGIPGNGDNVLPMMHVRDLASVVAKVLDSPPETPYMVAVDKARNTLSQVIKAISERLGVGKATNLQGEAAQQLLLDDPTTALVLQTNLVFDTSEDASAVHGMGLEW